MWPHGMCVIHGMRAIGDEELGRAHDDFATLSSPATAGRVGGHVASFSIEAGPNRLAKAVCRLDGSRTRRNGHREVASRAVHRRPACRRAAKKRGAVNVVILRRLRPSSNANESSGSP